LAISKRVEVAASTSNYKLKHIAIPHFIGGCKPVVFQQGRLL